MFAELVCGPPGCGKTTYCEAKRQFLSVYDPERAVFVINLDPANEGVFPYPCDADIRSIVSHAVISEREALGPNGAYVLCAEAICQRLDSIEALIEEAMLRRSQEMKPHRPPHLLIDAPGQVEFYLLSDVISTFSRMLEKRFSCTVCVVHLLDAGIVTRDVYSYISGCLSALSVMTHNELPQVNFMTKWDQLEDPDAAMEYLSVGDVVEGLPRLWSSASASPSAAPSRLKGLGTAILTTVEGYSILGFRPIAVESQDMMLEAVRLVDSALGNYC